MDSAVGIRIGNAQLALPAGARVQHGQDVIVGLRPDELRLATAGDIACKVVQSFIAGSTTLTTVETASGHTLNVVEPERREHPQGREMSVICSYDAMLLFNSETEGRISGARVEMPFSQPDVID